MLVKAAGSKHKFMLNRHKSEYYIYIYVCVHSVSDKSEAYVSVWLLITIYNITCEQSKLLNNDVKAASVIIYKIPFPYHKHVSFDIIDSLFYICVYLMKTRNV